MSGERSLPFGLLVCICERKDADQLRSNREADQRFCFRYTDSTIPLFPKSEISSVNAYFSCFNSSRCGVMVLLNNNFEYKEEKVISDTNGNFIILDIKIYKSRG